MGLFDHGKDKLLEVLATIVELNSFKIVEVEIFLFNIFVVLEDVQKSELITIFKVFSFKKQVNKVNIRRVNKSTIQLFYFKWLYF